MSGLDHRLEPEGEVRRLEVINGAMGRRRWTPDDRARILEETLAPGAVVSAVARRHGLTPQQLFTWRREARKASEMIPAFVPAVVTPDPPAVAYVYAPDRKGERPVAHLDGFTGILQVDGYGGYKALAGRNAVNLAFCWAHARRRFYELAQAGSAPIASEALQRIAELYHVEAAIRGRPPDERQATRREKSRPIIEALEPWLRAKLALISQKTKLAEAIRYALSRWEGLTLFLDDGRVELDNNIVERSIRPLALTRKNALFAGSDGGAEHWAVIASLVETCKLNGIDPQAYLADVITRIVNGHPNSRIDDLMPWAYPAQLALSNVA